MISIDYTLIIVILNFIVLLIILNKLLYKPINKFLKERQKKIENSLDETEKMRQKANNLVKKQEEGLKKSTEDIRNLKNLAKKDAESQAEIIVNQAKDQEKKILQETGQQLFHEKEKVVEKIKKELSTMVVSLSRKFVSDKLDVSKDKEIIEKLLKDKE